MRPLTVHRNKVGGGRMRLASLAVLALALVGFAGYAASSRNNPASHAAAINPYASSCTNYPVLKVGSTGNCVKFLQQIFHDSGFGTVVTGKFDANTNSAVVFYQANAGLPDNGIVDTRTWTTLLKQTGAAAPPASTTAPKTTTTAPKATSTSTTAPTATSIPANPAPSSTKPILVVTPIVLTNPYAADCQPPRPVIQEGATGGCVKYLQQIFKNNGFGIAVTGTFDANTNSAVVFYQAIKKMPDNGAVNGPTWGALTGDSRVTSQVLGQGAPVAVQEASLCLPPRPVLQEGATGGCVKYLQEIFRAANFGITVTGTFDAKTYSAVVFYQANKKLTDNGVVNGATWAGLTGDSRVTSQVLGQGAPAVAAASTVNPYASACSAPRPTLQESASGNCVKYLQQIFKGSGFNVAVDGSFGPITQSAVAFYQSHKGLPTTGVVGPATWGALTGDARVNGQTLGTGTWSVANYGAGNLGGGTTIVQAAANGSPSQTCDLACYLTAMNKLASSGSLGATTAQSMSGFASLGAPLIGYGSTTTFYGSAGGGGGASTAEEFSGTNKNMGAHAPYVSGFAMPQAPSPTMPICGVNVLAPCRQ